MFYLGFRTVSVGVDTETYRILFDIISNTDFTSILSGSYASTMEIGYALFMKICSLIINDYYFFQVVYSIIYCSLFARFILKETDNIYIGVVVFLGIGLFELPFNLARQILAVALVSNGWISFKNRNWKSLVLFMILAFLCHKTAILFTIVYILYFFRNNKLFIRLTPFIIAILVLTYEKWIKFGEVIFGGYGNYYSNMKIKQTAGLVWIVWLFVLFVALVILYNFKKYNIELVLPAIFSIGWVACNIIGLSFNYFERIGLYFTPFIPLMFASSPGCVKNVFIRRIYIIGMTSSFLAYFLFGVLNSQQYIYSTFFNIRMKVKLYEVFNKYNNFDICVESVRKRAYKKY